MLEGLGHSTMIRSVRRSAAWFRESFFPSAKFGREMHPATLVLLGYASYVLLGWILLCVPWAQRTGGVTALDNLFIATSAVSTTGLTTVSTADDYSLFGQIVILVLIQLGGIGYMTLGSFVILSRGEALNPVRARVGRAVFSLPAGFRIDRFVRSVIKFTLVIELAGTVALYAAFRRAEAPDAAWSALFHSVSAFCTAGFSLYNTSFEAYANDFWINVVIAGLSVFGAVGFIVWADLWRRIRGESEGMTLTSKIIISFTLWLTVGGTLLFYVTEPSIVAKPVDQRLLAAFFQVMTASTTVGFNTVPVGEISKASILLLTVLMVIGASPSGTGGGVKCTTVSAVFGVMRSAVHGDSGVRFRGRAIPLERVWLAVASFGFYIVALVIGTYLLEMTEPSSFDRNLFEAASALGTVGLSLGITPTLTALGKVIVIVLMFCGRLGPLTFALALFTLTSPRNAKDSDLAV